MAAPRTDKEKRLSGTYRADRARKPRTDRGAPAMPKWLSKDAKREWKSLVPKLRQIGLASVDGGVLGVYCQSLADIGTLESEIRERGHTFETPKGYIAKHPACTLLREARQTVLRAGSKLGLNPVDRKVLPEFQEQAIDELTWFQIDNAMILADEDEQQAILDEHGVTAAAYKAHCKSKHFRK